MSEFAFHTRPHRIQAFLGFRPIVVKTKVKVFGATDEGLIAFKLNRRTLFNRPTISLYEIIEDRKLTILARPENQGAEQKDECILVHQEQSNTMV